MAFQASLPLLVMGGAVCGLSFFATNYNKRETLEHCATWEQWCLMNGIVPPRTKYDPFVARHIAPAVEELCEKTGRPYSSVMGMSAITPGGYSDPYRYVAADGVVQMSFKDRATFSKPYTFDIEEVDERNRASAFVGKSFGGNRPQSTPRVGRPQVKAGPATYKDTDDE